MKAYVRSLHSQANQAALAAEGALREDSIIQQLQNADRQERIRNRAAIKCLILCTHSHTITHNNNIPHTTNSDKLVEWLVACGGEISSTSWRVQKLRNAIYTFHIAAYVYSWVCSSSRYMGWRILTEMAKKTASYYSIMADGCVHWCLIRLWRSCQYSVAGRWLASGALLGNGSLSASWCRKHPLSSKQVFRRKSWGGIVGIGFDGAATFSDKRSSVQARMKKYVPHALLCPATACCS